MLQEAAVIGWSSQSRESFLRKWPFYSSSSSGLTALSHPGLLLFAYTLHPLHQQIWLALHLKYVQNLPMSHHLGAVPLCQNMPSLLCVLLGHDLLASTLASPESNTFRQFWVINLSKSCTAELLRGFHVLINILDLQEQNIVYSLLQTYLTTKFFSYSVSCNCSSIECSLDNPESVCETLSHKVLLLSHMMSQWGTEPPTTALLNWESGRVLAPVSCF